MQSPKVTVQGIARRLGIHERLRASWLYDLYWSVQDPERINGRKREVSFYRNLLGGFRAGDIVFDIGANVGEKADIFLRLGARVCAAEPDEACQEILKEKFLKYRLRPRRVEVIGKAVSDSAGNTTMWIDGPGSAINTLSNKWVDTLKENKARFEHTRGHFEFQQHRQVETTTLDELILAHGAPFFVKIDVEGHEASVLRGLHHSVPYVSFEVNLPEFKPEGQECIEVLSRLAKHGRYNYAADCKGGLLLRDWVDASTMSRLLDECGELTVEVFWSCVRGNGHYGQKGETSVAECVR